MSTVNADQNLLFGFIALQVGLLSREDLIAATSVWLQDKSQPLDQVLVERGLLSEDDHEMLVPLVRRHLAQHNGNAEKSLAAIDALSSVRDELRRLGDEDLEASLAQVTERRQAGGEVSRTIAWSPTSPDARYQVLRPHAKGGLGLVSVALDEELKREVAFKEIQEQYAHDEDGRARFVREAEITGGLEHPGIVPVYGLGQYEDGRPYYAMRLVKGENLRDAIERFHEVGEKQFASGERSLAFRQLLGQFVDVCNTIQYAHSRGILHRDIKPANIMLGKYGETLVVDWGLAKSIGRSEEHRGQGEKTLQPVSGADSSRTRLGSAIGTPSFMSPEQAAGRLDDLGPTSDVYSLGATLYCILTGKPPLHESDAGTAIRKAQTGDFPPPRQIKAKVPAALEAVCLKAMDLDPTHRYPSAAALSADIERWLADEPVEAYHDSLSERVARFTRRNRTWVQAAAAATLLVTVCAVAAAIFTNAARRNEASARKKAELLVQSEAKLREETQRLLYTSDMNVALQEWTDGNIDRVILRLKQHRPNSGGQDLRGFEWYHLWKLCSGVLQTPRLKHDSYVVSLDFSPRQNKLATAGNKWVTVWDLDSYEKKVYESAEQWTTDVAFSPDGARLAAANFDKTVKVWNVELDVEDFTIAHDEAVWAVEFSPDGELLASGSGHGDVFLWDAKSGKKLNRLQGAPSASGSMWLAVRLAFCPTDHVLASGTKENNAIIWDIESGEELDRLHVDSRVKSLQFSPDGGTIAIRTDNEVVLWDWRNDARQRLPIKGNSDDWGSVAFSSDGAILAVDRPVHAVQLIDVATGEELGSIVGHSANVNSTAVSPQGDILATASYDDTVRLWEWSNQMRPASFRGHSAIVRTVEFSADGDLLLTSGGSAVRLWDTRSWSLRQTVDDQAGGGLSATLSPDGKSLVYSGGRSRGQSLLFWDIETQRAGNSIDTSGRASWSVTFSRDKRYLAAACGDGLVRLWTLSEAEQVPRTLPGHVGDVRKVVFSPDGRLLASGGADFTVKLWDPATGTLLHDLTDHTQEVWALAFSPDGDVLLSGCNDRTIRLWNARNGQPIATLTTSTGLARCLAFSPNEATLAAGTDRSVTLWDMKRREERARFRCQENVWSLAFSPDGRTLVAGLFDGTIRVWQAADPEEVRQAGW